MNLPRLLYRGPCDDTAETKRVETLEQLAAALADGWRLRRMEQPAPTPVAKKKRDK